jgi:hypothetical protein
MRNELRPIMLVFPGSFFWIPWNSIADGTDHDDAIAAPKYHVNNVIVKYT